jgi:hypothetical protein
MRRRISWLLLALMVPLSLLTWLLRPLPAQAGPALVTIPELHKDDGALIYSRYVITNLDEADGTLVHTFFEPGGTVLWEEVTTITTGAAITYDLGSFAILPFFFTGYAEVTADVPITGTAICGPRTPPLVSFRATPLTGNPPLTVQFANETCGLYETLIWDFGDGAISFAADPAHDFAARGSYTVTLTALAPNLSRADSRPAYIRVGLARYLPIARR